MPRGYLLEGKCARNAFNSGPDGGPMLSVIRATAAPVGRLPLLTVLVDVANEHPTLEAGARTLQAGIVSLYGVVVILVAWAWVGCARLSGVHTLRGIPRSKAVSTLSLKFLE